MSKPARFNLRHFATALSAAVAMAFMAAPARAQVPGLDLYVGAGVGQSNTDISDPDFDDKNMAWKAFVGVRALSFLGAELNYIDLGKVSGDGLPDLKYKALAGFGLYYLPIPLPVLDVYVKAGMARLDVKVSDGGGSDDDTKFAYGAGAQLKFGSFAVRGEYERFKVPGGNPSLLSLGFSKSFL